MWDRTEGTRDRMTRSGAPRRRRTLALEGLEARELLTASIAPIPDINSPQNIGYQLAVDGSGSGVASQNFVVTSSNPNVKVTAVQGQFLTLNVTHTAANANDISFTGSMTYQLFGDLTPNTVKQITQLVNGGFYTNTLFHRISASFPGPNDYIAQGGSQNASGPPPSNPPYTGFPFADEFVQSVAFTSNYQLAMANSGSDTNNSQFFVTTGSPRFLDYKHTIFAQLVSGKDIVTDMTKVATSTSDGTSPLSPITITSATLNNLNPNLALHVDTTTATAGQTSTVTVTATDTTTNTTATQTFRVNVTKTDSSISERPFLNPQPTNQTVGVNQPNVFQITYTDANPNAKVAFKVADPTSFATPANATVSIDQSTGIATITPKTGFTGTIPLLVGVRDSSTTDTQANYDTQQITLTVNAGGQIVQTPIALNSTTTVIGASGTSIQLTSNNANPTASPQPALTYTLVSQPGNGTISAFDSSRGTFNYTPNPGFSGQENVQFTVSTPSGNSTLTSMAATASIIVQQGTATGPTLSPLPKDQTVGLNQSAIFQLSVSNPNPATKLAYTVQGGVNAAGTAFTPVSSNVTATVDQATGVVTVKPTSGFTGTVPLLVGVRDASLSDTPSSYNYDTINMTVTSSTTNILQTPIALPGSYTVLSTNPTQIQLLANNANPGTTPPPVLTYSIVTPPKNGSLSNFNSKNGSVTYTPNAGYDGIDSFNFAVSTPSGSTTLTSNPSAVTLTVQGGTVRVINRVLVVTPLPRTDGGTNSINLTQVNGNIQVTINGVLFTTQPAASSLDSIVVFGSKNSDNIHVDQSVTLPATLDGGHGGTNSIAGGAGGSTLHGWFGRNTLQGGPAGNMLIGQLKHVRFKPSPGNVLLFTGQPKAKGYVGASNPVKGTFYKFVGNRLVAIKSPPKRVINTRQRSTPQ